MSWTKTKPKVEPQKRVWITNMLHRLGRKPVVTQQPEEEEDDFSGVNPFYQGGEGSSSGGKVQKLDRAELLQQLRGTGEDIKRERTIGTSVDRGYKRDVSKPIDEFLKKNGNKFSDGSKEPLTSEHLKDILKLRETLVSAGEGYDDRSNDEESSEKKRDQRERKSNAVINRVQALDELTGLTPTGLAQWLIPTKAPEDSRFVAIPTKDADELTQKAVSVLIDDEDKLNAMLGDMVSRQIDRETRGTDVQQAKKSLMRSNTAFSKAIQEVLRQHKESREFCEDYQEDIKGLFSDEVNELNPDKIEGQDKQKAAAQAADRVAKLVEGVLKQTMSRSLPGPIDSILQEVAKQARKVGLDDDRDVAIALGGVVMLRVLVPQITALMPKLGPNGKRTAILVSKAVQDLANGTLDKTDKEQFMVPLYRKLKAWEAPFMTWMLRVAEG